MTGSQYFQKNCSNNMFVNYGQKNMYKVSVFSCTFNNLCILYFAFIFDFYFDKNIMVNISFVNVTFTLEII